MQCTRAKQTNRDWPSGGIVSSLRSNSAGDAALWCCILSRETIGIVPGMLLLLLFHFSLNHAHDIGQAAQNMAINHLTKSCRSIADDTKETLIKLKAQKSTVLGGGKNFWANGAKVLGVFEVEEGHLRFHDG
jgi:hypothetical protein